MTPKPRSAYQEVASRRCFAEWGSGADDEFFKRTVFSDTQLVSNAVLAGRPAPACRCVFCLTPLGQVGVASGGRRVRSVARDSVLEKVFSVDVFRMGEDREGIIQIQERVRRMEQASSS